MPIRFDCPSCKAHYDVADDLGGKMIMCRVCQKRGPVRNTTSSSTPTLSSVGQSAPPTPSRRNFLLIGSGVAASLGAIATGALLAQWRPWRHWGEDTSRNRGRRGPGGGGPPGGGQPGGGQPGGGQPGGTPPGEAASK